MYTKSEEEVSAVLQILPETFKSKFGEELDLNAVKDHLVKTLEKAKTDVIERQFMGWNTDSLLNMLKVIESKTSSENAKTNKKGKK